MCSQHLLFLCLQAILQYSLRSWHQLCADSHVRLRHRLPSNRPRLFSTFLQFLSLWRKFKQSPNRQLQQCTLLVTKRVPVQNTNTVTTGRVAECQSPSTVVITRPPAPETVLCECHSGCSMDGTTDRNKCFMTTCLLRQVDPWQCFSLLAAAGSLTILYQLLGILIGTNPRTVMLVKEALNKRGVLTSKCPIEHG